MTAESHSADQGSIPCGSTLVHVTSFEIAASAYQQVRKALANGFRCFAGPRILPDLRHFNSMEEDLADALARVTPDVEPDSELVQWVADELLAGRELSEIAAELTATGWSVTVADAAVEEARVRTRRERGVVTRDDVAGTLEARYPPSDDRHGGVLPVGRGSAGHHGVRHRPSARDRRRPAPRRPRSPRPTFQDLIDRLGNKAPDARRSRPAFQCILSRESDRDPVSDCRPALPNPTLSSGPSCGPTSRAGIAGFRPRFALSVHRWKS